MTNRKLNKYLINLGIITLIGTVAQTSFIVYKLNKILINVTQKP